MAKFNDTGCVLLIPHSLSADQVILPLHPLQQPGHVFTQNLHGPNALFVLFHPSPVETQTHVPIAGTRDDHLTDEEEVVDGIEDVDAACAPHGNDGRTHLALEHVTVRHGHKTSPVDQGLHLGSDASEIGGRPQNDPMCLDHLLNALVQNVVPHRTTPIPVLVAPEAGPAAPDLLAGKLKQLGVNSLLLQLAKHGVDENGGIPVPSRASIEGDDPHCVFRSSVW